ARGEWFSIRGGLAGGVRRHGRGGEAVPEQPPPVPLALRGAAMRVDARAAAERRRTDDAWRQLTGSLGLPEAPMVGQQVSASNAPALSGRVERFQSRLMTLLLDAPSRGIGVVGTESFDGKGFPMVYLYLFGAGAEEALRQDRAAWHEWINRTFDPAVSM